MRSHEHVLCAVLAVCALTGLTKESRAQQATTTGTATALFDEAVALMARGDLAAACPKLARSNELSPNGGTLFALAECYERDGKVASAWVTYKEAAIRANAAKRPEPETKAREAADRLAAKVSRLVIDVPPAAAAVEGLTIELDGRKVARAEWGVAAPIDPGTHRLLMGAPGHVPATREVAFDRVASQKTVAVPVLEAAPREVLAAGEGAPRGRTQRIAGFVAGGVGLAGIAVGTVFGLQASSRNDEAASHCTGANVCDAEGLRLDDEGRRAATISTVAFIAGGALAVGGLVLVLTAPSGREKSSAWLPRSTIGVRGAPGGGAAFTFGAAF